MRCKVRNISREEFSNYLMEQWYEGNIGSWGKDLALAIQAELYKEFLDEINK